MAISIQSLVKMFVPYMNTNVKVNTTPINVLLNNRYNGIYDSDNIEDTSELTQAISKIFIQTVETRNGLYELIDQVKDLDMASYIRESVIDDAFNSTDTEKPFEVLVKGNHYDVEEAQKACDKFTEKFDIYQLFLDIIDDFLTYGEYYLHTIPRKGYGIVEINDSVETKNVISIYKNYKLVEHIGFVNDNVFADTSYNAATSDIMRIHKDLLTHFILDARKIRLKVNRTNSVLALPDIIRVGRSLLYPVIKLLKKSDVLDTAIMSKDLRSALLPLILAVTMPGVSTPGDAIACARKYEKYFIDNTNLAMLAQDGNLDKRMIFNNVGRIKILPTFQDGKAALNKFDYDSDTSAIQQSKDKTDDRILQIVGLPGTSENMTRAEILKSKSKYSKRLVDIQRSCAAGLRNLYYKNLLYKGIYINENNIEVRFKNLVNADIFDEAESMISLVSVMQDFINFVNTCADSENLNIGVNTDVLIKTFNLLLGDRYVNLDNMLYNKNNIESILKKSSDVSGNVETVPIEKRFGGSDIDEPDYEMPDDYDNSEPEEPEEPMEIEEPVESEPETPET